MDLQFTDTHLGGYYGAKQVVLFDQKYVYKTVRPENEVAAYELYKQIKPFKRGHWYVPKTTFTDNNTASLQEFIEDAVTGDKVRYAPYAQFSIDTVTAAEIQAFDFLITQGDRHNGNFLVDLTGQIVLIDHGNAFNLDWGYVSRSFKQFIDYEHTIDYWPKLTPYIFSNPNYTSTLRRNMALLPAMRLGAL